MVNFISAVLSGASGGGGAIISTPLMILLGLSPAQAIATAKFGGLGITSGASSRFIKEKLIDKRTVIIFSIIGTIGALGGSLVLSHFQSHAALLQKLIGIAILSVGVPALYIRKAGIEARPTAAWQKIVGLPLLLLGVFIQVAVSGGVGGLQMIVLIWCYGMTALVANATRRAMQLVVAIISLAVFIPNGLVDYSFGIVAFITALAGGFIGAHIAIKKGNKFIINLFAALSVILALQLLLS